MGLHPWHLENHEEEFKRLSRFSLASNVLAIGECGLDKVCHTDWEVQVEVFKQQIALANELGKPLITHCVRAYNELIMLLDECKVNVSVVIHGFNKKPEVARQLLRKGYLLSFGTALLKNETTAAVFKDIPVDRFLLETDDSGLLIEQVYNRAAEIKETDLDSIILQAGNNFITVFNL
jgi:TatD DNase family protein